MEDYMKLKSKEVQPLSPKQFKNMDDYTKALDEFQKAEREGKAQGDAYSPDGKLWAGTPEMMWNSLKELYNPIPTMAKNLGTKEGQDQLDKIGSLLVSLIMIAFAVTLFAFPQEGIAVVVAVLSAALVIGGIRMFVYYFSMARHMVGGLTILYRAIILLDLGLFTATLNSIPLPYVMLYLASIHAFSGAVGIMRAGSKARRHGVLEAPAAARGRRPAPGPAVPDLHRFRAAGRLHLCRRADLFCDLPHHHRLPENGHRVYPMIDLPSPAYKTL